MKKIFMILLFLIPFGVYAQTDRELLLELIKQQTELSKQVAETNKQVAENNKQIAITNTKVDSLDKRIDTLEKSVDKRFEMQSNLIMGMMGFLAVLIGVLIWDRRAANAPLEAKTSELKREIDLLKEKELKHQERETKLELYVKQISQIDNRFAPFN